MLRSCATVLEALAGARLVDGDEHIVRRRLSVARRSRCAIDGTDARLANSPRSRRPSRCIARTEQLLLLDPARQLAILDSWGARRRARRRNTPVLEPTTSGAPDARGLERARGKDEQELEFMRFTCEQVEINPQPGELEELEDDLPGCSMPIARADLANACAAQHDDGGSPRPDRPVCRRPHAPAGH